MQMPRVLVPTGGWNVRGGTTPQQVIEAARAAEAAGIDGLFSGDHVTFYGRGNDGLMNLAVVAAHTQRVLLQTSVYLLALRHPTPVALQTALLDQLCGGRLILGVGVGGEDPAEWWACGVDPKTRGGRTDEAMQILRSLWTQDETTFDGRYHQLDHVQLVPKPLQQSGVPLWVGGRSDAAIRRAARYGDGYSGIWISTRRFQELQEKRVEFAAEAGRADGPFSWGMQFWLGVDDDPKRAERKVAERMEQTYRLPFDRFERYVPHGTPQQVAEFIMGYVELGCAYVNLIPTEPSPQPTLEAALRIQEHLQTMCAAG